MAIDFSCPRCGSRFSVAASFAGKAGRCSSCRHQMTIPRQAAAPPPSTGMFRLSTADRSAAVGAVGMFPSNVGLAPLTEELRRPGEKATPRQYSFNPDLLKETDPGSTYKMVESRRALSPVARQPSARPPGPLGRFWKGRMRDLIALLRQISDLTYLAMIPCALLILVAVVIDRRDLAVLGAVGVVATSLARMVVEILALIAGPFRESPLQGILTFIPPFTFLYLSRYPKRTKRALGRAVAPALWIGGVVLAFLFVPNLSSRHGEAEGSALDRARSEAAALGQGIEAKLDDPEAAVGELKSQLRGGVDRARQSIDSRRGSPDGPSNTP